MHAFSSKERDAETGLSYFGARYYSSDLSLWLAVDPMADKYPSMSPYTYCANNPVKLVDPNGMQWETPEDESIAKSLISKAKSQSGINNEAITKIMSKKELTTEDKTELNDLIHKNNFLSEGISNLMDMGNENTETYHFNLIEDNGLAGNVKLRDDGVININYAGDQWAWHECVHIGDYKNFVDKWNFNGDCFLGTTDDNFVNSEYKAYQSQYAFDEKGFIYSGTSARVRSLHDVTNWVKSFEFDKPIK